MPVLAGDVGGTKALLALVERAGQGVRVLAERRFPSSAYPGLAPIVQEFIAASGAPVDTACLGVPGAVFDGACTTPNLPWYISEADLSQATGLKSVRLVNDFAAAAMGVLALPPGDLVVLQEGKARPQSTRAVLGAGTGLGEALLVWDGRHYQVVPTEAGHVDFAPQGDLQRALQSHLEGRHGGRVSLERVLSGPGLARIYDFLVASGVPTSPETAAAMQHEDRAAVISGRALTGSDEACVRALALFVTIYGQEAGNLALRSLPAGGIYVAGGIAPKIRATLEEGAFLRAFRRKGRHSDLMETFPVYLVLNPGAGLLGAALLACDLEDA